MFVGNQHRRKQAFSLEKSATTACPVFAEPISPHPIFAAPGFGAPDFRRTPERTFPSSVPSVQALFDKEPAFAQT